MNKKSSVIFSPDRVYNLTGFETVYFKQISPNVYKLHTAYPSRSGFLPSEYSNCVFTIKQRNSEKIGAEVPV